MSWTATPEQIKIISEKFWRRIESELEFQFALMRLERTLDTIEFLTTIRKDRYND